MSIIIALLILSFLVFFHELGHFIVARICGVKVEVFSIGFGKKLAYFTHKGTQYAISLIPLGGYVKLKGQDDTALDTYKEGNYEADSYLFQSPLKRIAILLAGPLFNLLLAFVIYVGIGLNGKDSLLAVVGEVVEGSSAYMAGVQPKDRILRINDKHIISWEELDRAILDAKGTINLLLLRGGNEVQITLSPQMTQTSNIFGERIMRPIIGIKSSGEMGRVYYRGLSSIEYGLKETLKASTLIFQSITKLISGIIPSSEISGVVGIVSIISTVSKISITSLLILTALISVNLGILNLLPIPALDGGHIAFNCYELFTRKMPNEKIAYYLTISGWAVLLSLMLLGLYNDIFRLLG